eukprot:123925-Prorocentrum_minimum.AAC.1
MKGSRPLPPSPPCPPLLGVSTGARFVRKPIEERVEFEVKRGGTGVGGGGRGGRAGRQLDQSR